MIRNKFYGIAIVALLCFILIAYNHKETKPVQSTSVNFQAIELDSNDFENDVVDLGTETPLEDVIKSQERRINRELRNYKLPPNTTLEKLTLATGGQPIRTVILTTWRSGSTFLGDVINALPGNYYHYEPLLHYGIMQIRGPPFADEALRVLKNLLNCDYTNLTTYLDYGMSHIYLFTHNKRLWAQCEMYPQYCWSSTFLNQFCSLFPFHSMKVLRIRLKLAEELLQDKKMNVKIVFLVRDPRGTLQSRKHREWCPGVSDCDQPNVLCSDMVADYSAAIKLKELYPDRFKVVRYEDLSLDPHEGVRELFKFMGLQVAEEVREFINSHTTMNLGGVSSTYRDSKSAPFHWKMDLNYTEIQFIEDNCEQAMKLWGYVKTKGPDLKDFDPLEPYVIARKRVKIHTKNWSNFSTLSKKN